MENSSLRRDFIPPTTFISRNSSFLCFRDITWRMDVTEAWPHFSLLLLCSDSTGASRSSAGVPRTAPSGLEQLVQWYLIAQSLVHNIYIYIYTYINIHIVISAQPVIWVPVYSGYFFGLEPCGPPLQFKWDFPRRLLS